jgi:hypothetical protein
MQGIRGLFPTADITNKQVISRKNPSCKLQSRLQIKNRFNGVDHNVRHMGDRVLNYLRAV